MIIQCSDMFSVSSDLCLSNLCCVMKLCLQCVQYGGPEGVLISTKTC